VTGMNTAGRVRIIGGAWRRRTLRFPADCGLRPTPDRVRETLFNWLGQELDGLSCLDLFAGSGALGIEAASRGAGRVTLVERSAPVFKALKANIAHLQATQIQGAKIEVCRADARDFIQQSLNRTGPAYDLLFLDPPFGQGWLPFLASLLSALLKPDGRLYVESETPVSSLGDWRTIKSGHTRQVNYHLLQCSKA